MAGSVNRVTILGNLGRDPESRSFQNGGKVVNLNVATSESWKDKNSGERRAKTEWHTVAIFNEALAGVAEKYLRKGSKVYIEGALQTRKWTDKDGGDRYSTEIVLQGFDAKLVMLDGKPADTRDGGWGSSNESYGSDNRNERQGQSVAGRAGASVGGGGGGFGADLDDDIPFATCHPDAEGCRHVA